MLSRAIKVSFVGGSINSAVGRTHFNALNLDGRFQLVGGFFSRDPHVNAKTGSSFGIDDLGLHNSIEELIGAKQKSDLIVVLSPTPAHEENLYALKSVPAHILCEKALTTSVDSSSRIGGIFKESQLSVVFNYTGFPMIREIQKRIARGDIGKIQQISIEMPQEGFEKRTPDGKLITPQPWRLSDGTIPTISLDLGVHLHSLVRFLTGEKPLSVFSKSRSYGNFPSVIDTQFALIQYENDLLVNLWITKSALGERNGLKIRVFGSSGSYSWIQESPDHFSFTNFAGVRFLVDRGDPTLCIANQNRYMRFKPGHPTGFIEAMANYYMDVAARIEGASDEYSGNYVYGWKESHEGLQLMDALWESSKLGKEVVL